MSRFYICDECETESVDNFAFELTQICDELDEDGDQEIVILHLCSAACLVNYAMTLVIDFPDEQQQD